MSDKNYPFSNGTQYMDWQESNCCTCAKYRPDETDEEKCCPIEYALSFAAIDDGSVTDEIARRMGYKPGPPFYYVWECTEREPKYK